MKSFTPSPLFVWKLLLITLIAAVVILTQIDPVIVHIKQRQKELPKKLEQSRTELPRKLEPSTTDLPEKLKRSGAEIPKKAEKLGTEIPKKSRKGKKVVADIIFFGDSLMQAATPTTEAEINSILSNILAKPVRAVNLSMDGRSSVDLELRVEEILKLNPRIIVLQPEMMVGRVTRVKEGKPRFLQEERERLKNWINYAKTPLLKRFISGGSKKKREELLNALASPAQVDIGILKNTDPQEQTENEVFLRTVREHWTGQIISLRSPEYSNSRKFIEKAHASGASVVVVETPISETAAQYATAEYIHKRKEVILKLLRDDQSLYLFYPQTMPDKFFYDYTHVNRKGQKAFFKWLAPLLAEKLAEDK